MKIVIFLFLLVSCCVFGIQAFEKSGNEFEVSPIEQIITNDNGVFLLINDAWLLTQGFQASNQGLFAFVNDEWMPLSQAIEMGDYTAAWQCIKCKRYNMDGVNVCPYCGKRKNG